MNDSHIVSIAQLREFLKGGVAMSFTGYARKEVYAWMTEVLNRFRYRYLRKKDKTVVKAYLRKMTGYSDAQITRLISKKKQTGYIKGSTTKKNTFPKVYGPLDVALLIKVDSAHGRLSGPATKRVLEREYVEYGKMEYEQLRHISPSHIYNLRGTRHYRSKLGTFTKTNPIFTPIGERKRPNNEGKPGYIRVDSIHQGDYTDANGQKKGVYHINLVDEITQWEIVGSVEGISEQFLAPLLELLIKQFPFLIINFHSEMPLTILTQFAKQLSDTEAAEGMQKAKYQLFKSFREPAHPGI